MGSNGYYTLDGNTTSIPVDLIPGTDGEYPCIGSLQVNSFILLLYHVDLSVVVYVYDLQTKLYCIKLNKCPL